VSQLPVLPVALPALAAAMLLLLGDANAARARAVSVAATAALFLAALVLLAQSAAGVQSVYALGDWPAPFGIVLVADRLSALLVALTAFVALAALACAAQGWDTRGRHFHALFQFQLMGLNGAFLTGDLFNLFVFFEVMLIASYCLLLHGLGAARLRAAVHYVVFNLAASAVFLFAVSLLYSVTGTLNLAHLAERVDALAEGELTVARSAGLLLLGVFAVKAALFPLYFWLPAAYSSAAAPVAALFSIMTKVGIYAIVRVGTVAFGDGYGTTSEFMRPWLLPAALLTLALAALGAAGAERLAGLVAYLTVASVGSMLAAVAVGTTEALAAALFYLVHSTLVVAALFVLSDLIARQRGADHADRLVPGPALNQPALLGVAFLVGAATLAGMPPSSGFLGKVMILHSVQGAADTAWVWGVILAASFVAVLSCARAGSLIFWNIASPAPAAQVPPVRGAQWLPFAALLGGCVLLVVFAAPAQRYAEATAAQTVSREGYVAAVLGDTAERAPRPLPAGGAP
jgi:multicomponent K+:H+ antiporter subunit D